MAMGSNVMQYMSYLIMLTTCIDQGDGRWRERDKENLERDILEFRRLAGKLGHEIETFYDDYQHEWLDGDEVDKIQGKYLTKRLNRNTKDTIEQEEKPHTYQISKEEIKPPIINENRNIVPNQNHKQNKEIDSDTGSDWPNFDELLQSFGMKYDWKNDRWVKVKQKHNMKKEILKSNVDNENKIHSEKHKFSYTTVKLNKSKSRRNVVVAVSAVR